MRAWRRRRSDCGSIAIFVALACLVLVLVASSMARSGAGLIERARADSAAEAAALGAVAGADPASIAETNGATLVEASRAPGSKWIVRVRVGDTEATAAAMYSGLPTMSGPLGNQTTGGGGRREGLAPETLRALEQADALLAARGLPSPIPVVSGLRSRAEQEALWARRFLNPYPVAPPGTSAHERGLAVDIPRNWVPLVLEVAEMAGLCQPYPDRDPIHFGPVGSPECGGSSEGMWRGKPVLVPIG
jgi:hypothetical protein